MHAAIPYLLPLALLAAAPVLAGDHDEARRAMRSGEVRPLETILSALPNDLTGDLVDARLNRAADPGDRWRYVLKLLNPDGRLRRVTVDGATGDVLKVEGR